jgi:hypothetical protein
MTELAPRRENRRHRRFTLGLPVRVRIEGLEGAGTVELWDVSFRGCCLRVLEKDMPPLPPETKVAFGFVLPERRMVLAKGRVVRQDHATHAFAIAIEQANVPFYQFLLELSEGHQGLAA